MQVRGITPVLYDNVEKAILAIFGQTIKELEYSWKQIFNVKTSDKKFERVTSLTMFGDVPEKGEGDDYVTDIIRPGYSKDFTHLEYGLGFKVSKTALEDDQYDQLVKAAQWLAFSARYTEAKLASNVINNGFSTEKTPDAVVLFSTAHTLAGGGTGYNRPTTDADLSVSSLTQGLIDLQLGAKLDSGQLGMPVTGLKLYIPPHLEFTADRILNSAGLPGSADNDRNPIKALRNISIVVDPLLTDTDAWFLVAADKARHGITMYNRVPISAEPVYVDAADNKLFKIRYRKSVGAADWRNVYGTTGA